MKNKKFLPFILSLLYVIPCLTGCQKEKTTVLRVLNMEDYIYLYEEGDEDSISLSNDEIGLDLIDQFALKMEQEHPELGNVEVVYTSTATNESLYSELKTGKANYDVICPSDYMIQKLIYDQLLMPLDKARIPNYFTDDYNETNHVFSDSIIKTRLSEISQIDKADVVNYVGDYSVGYMWGTLGMLFNPDFDGFNDYAKDNIFNDAKEWAMLWNPEYKGTFSIKNSVRDTYAVGAIQANIDHLLSSEEFANSGFDTYSKYIQKYMNDCSEEAVENVYRELLKLKDNCFGLEVDSGKRDIVTGMIGINLAWSGDATYAMEEAASVDKTLYYSVPDVGANIWFDGWAVPKRENRTADELTLTYEWLNYLSDDSTVTKNVYYTGYTPFISGHSTRDYFRDCFDARTDYMFYEHSYLEDGEEITEYLPVYFKYNGINIPVSYEYFEDNSLIHKPGFSSLPLFYELNDIEYPFYDPNEIIEEPLETKDLTLSLFDSSDYQHLTNEVEYFFGTEIYDESYESIDEFLPEGELGVVYYAKDASKYYSWDGLNYIEVEISNDYNHSFYTTYYQPFISEGNSAVGLDFFCALPSFDTVTHCAIMEFDVQNNANMLRMWEDFKSDPLPVWAWILIIVFALIVICIATFTSVLTYTKKKLQNARKNKN